MPEGKFLQELKMNKAKREIKGKRGSYKEAKSIQKKHRKK